MSFPFRIPRARWVAPFAATTLLGLLAAACGSSSSVPLTHVFQKTPWTGDETLTYNLLNQGGSLDGVCVLSTTVGTPPGKTTLAQKCTKAGSDAGRYTDDRSAVVDNTTLKPVSAIRTIADKLKGTSTVFRSTYGATQVTFNANDNGTLHQTTRDLPKPTSQSPDPGYYDDETLFWVMRGLPFAPNWKGAYVDISASIGQTFTATITVEQQEEVSVPAGKFSTWRVRLDTSSVTQYFWVETAPAHRVIKAQVEDKTYELTSAK